MSKTNIVLKIRKARRDKSKIKEVLNQKKFLTSKNSRVGNFIKPKLAIHFIGAEPKAAPSEKSKKSRGSYNDCKWHWPGLAGLISWCPICVLWWTLHSRAWCRINILEIIRDHSQNNDSRPALQRSKFGRYERNAK
jgi:hypothetical protein